MLYTFTDKQGQTLLERRTNGSETLDTYYVYDDYGCLRFVLQPEYQTTANLDLFTFQYKYDDHNNCIWKKLPGAQYVTYEYDSADRMIFSQDGVQRASGKWTFYVYDSLSRLTRQGENTSKAVADSKVYLQNYYDNYTSLRSAVGSNSNYPNDTSGNSRGFLTGTMTKVLGTDTKLYTAFYYDIEGHVTKKVQQNLLGGHDITTTTYSFSGKPLTVTHAHKDDNDNILLEEVYTYDEKDRVSMVKHKLGSTEVTLASYTYDTFGRMVNKQLHGSSTNQLTYSYNIQNWLTGISSTKFTQNLGYGSHYNGNISSMSWNANGVGHSYTFTYDGVNRLLDATHGAGLYTEKVTSYDKNGNIKGLQRYGNGLIDNLTYTYSGNQLTRIDDATGNSAGFSNGTSTTNEYTYDNNGNLTKDSNKNISTIAYNVLNLPQQVTFSDGSTIVYSYAADGTKLRTVHTINGTTTTKDYCANVVYENGVQKMLLTEEGYVDLSASTPTYYYYLKDHQGNNRVVINGSGTVVETNHYYPFGGVFASTGNVQPYKYNGKELDTKKGLNWYDYGARHYDATLGRWLVVDPLAEKMGAWSPYGYCYNSPVKHIDPDGEVGQVAIGAIVGGVIGGGLAIWQGNSFSGIVAATVGGAIDGAITATGIGLVGKIVTGVVGGGLGNAVEQGINVATDNQASINNTELVVSSMFGAIGGRASHQIDDIASKMIQTVDEKYATSATKNAIMKEVKSEMIEKGRELGHSTKQTINEMTKQRINVLSNMDKIFIKGGANTIDGGIGITNTIVNIEIMNWIDKKE